MPLWSSRGSNCELVSSLYSSMLLVGMVVRRVVLRSQPRVVASGMSAKGSEPRSEFHWMRVG